MSTENTGEEAAMPEPEIRERAANRAPGLPMLGLGILLLLAAAALTALGGASSTWWLLALGIALGIVTLVGLAGLVTVSPGEARVLQFLGRYTGTLRRQGLHWVNPLTTDRTRVSTRIRNHETSVMKVNDAEGNPIEIAAVVVWQVDDTAQASFSVDDFVEFVETQAETAVRHIATNYAYDSRGGRELSLRENAEEITAKLSKEIAERVHSAGVKVIESRLTHLAYAPEIAQSMLQRQQADAVVAARQRIVEGAVGMVESALGQLAEDQIVELDEERRASMVSNLLVVLCGDKATQPVVNTGSLYQ
ncbi:Regulator of protease activity HflC, stomatin/prohibitin superfamily [Actinopolyspora xinjiangensis]|uniref:Regulator of protease activity HflC, stomatin/prohibitin superfamily n=1 Tax=Actinopolyspora xinjiangensis TaxID=405564 RepID=A0A1H0U9H9_9ACTN|nr:SPFH domain-containing protein [Actinopolyspora xinjiangensis]SDP62824.1 Regulator of protease activity HflC, stomatin/prohibitin superfamily [Actinopolyspora xinjiangensis]